MEFSKKRQRKGIQLKWREKSKLMRGIIALIKSPSSQRGKEEMKYEV